MLSTCLLVIIIFYIFMKCETAPRAEGNKNLILWVIKVQKNRPRKAKGQKESVRKALEGFIHLPRRAYVFQFQLIENIHIFFKLLTFVNIPRAVEYK